MLKKVIKFGIELMGLFFLCLALWLVWREVHTLGWSQIVDKVTNLPLWILGLALVFIVCDYTALSGYDFLALKYIGAKLKKWLVVKTALVAFSITNTTGHAYMAGGSVRYFFYSKAGLTEFQVLKVIAFESLTFLMGIGVVLDVCLILARFMHLPKMAAYQGWLEAGAALLTLAFFAYVWFVVRPKRQLKLGKVKIKAPTLKMTLYQVVVGGCDILSASLVFYTLFRAHLDAPYLHVAVIFLIAQVIGISTQVPGGLGVFEASFLYLFQHTPNEKLSLLAVLISFRVLYYFLPLAISCLFLLIDWLKKLLSKQLSHNLRKEF